MLFSRKELEIFAPVEGDLQPIEKTPDAAFANKLMGDGFVVFPNGDGKVYAPFDGSVKFVFPSKQAIGIESKNKTELLIHIGLETGILNGEGFNVLVKDGQPFNKGDVLLEFDVAYLLTKVESLATPIIFTNLNGRSFNVVKNGEVTNQDIIAIVR